MQNSLYILFCCDLQFLRVVWYDVIYFCEFLIYFFYALFLLLLLQFYFLQVTCNISLISLSISRLVVSALALDWTSFITLTCNPYNIFVGMCSITNSRCYMSFTYFCIVFSSTSNISYVTLNLSLLFTIVYIFFSCSFYTIASYAFSLCFIVGWCNVLICSLYIMSCTFTIFSIISSLFTSATSIAISPLSWNLYVTNFASSSVAVSTRGFLWYFIFFLISPSYVPVLFFVGVKVYASFFFLYVSSSSTSFLRELSPFTYSPSPFTSSIVMQPPYSPLGMHDLTVNGSLSIESKDSPKP